MKDELIDGVVFGLHRSFFFVIKVRKSKQISQKQTNIWYNYISKNYKTLVLGG